MTIKNGSNTFLIGLAVYWQSYGLTCPIRTAEIMQHIRICKIDPTLKRKEWPKQSDTMGIQLRLVPRTLLVWYYDGVINNKLIYNK